MNKVEIYFWESTGSNPAATDCIFRLEYISDGYVRCYVGKPSYLRNRLKQIECWEDIKLPKVKWKDILGNDEDGGTIYKWQSE